MPGEAALGQGRPAASQDRRDGLSCLPRNDMGWRPGPRPTPRYPRLRRPAHKEGLTEKEIIRC